MDVRHLTSRALGLCQVLLLLAGAAVLTTPGFAQNNSPTQAQADEAPIDADMVGGAFDIAVHAPDELRDLLLKHTELQRYRAVTDLDEAELARLILLAQNNVRNLVGTLGYFSPTIDIVREGSEGARPTISITVEPGPLTRIRAVDIGYSGDIATSEEAGATAQKAAIESQWSLPVGERFTQDQWDAAKRQALRALVARRYPAGKISYSLADVNAPENNADLRVTLASGPLYRLGPLQVAGVQRYDPVLIPRLTRLSAGDVYDQNELALAQQRLASSGYFDSAFIYVDPDSDPAAAPVQIQVREAKLQKIILGVGISTDSGPRASVEHTHNRFPGIGWRAVTKLQLEKKSPFAQTEWTSIPDSAGWRWATLGRVGRQEDRELVTQTQRLRFGRFQTGDHIDRNLYLQFDRDSVHGAGLVGNSAVEAGDGSSLSANYAWSGRYFDSLPFPRSGFGVGFELGGGSTLSGKRMPYTRAAGRWMGIVPLERGRLALRAEGGGVWAQDSARIPESQLFRTGGDTSVRGYGYRDIGIPLANGAMGPGRYMTTASVEWQRPILRAGRPTEFENTLFIDAGAVADRPQDLRPVFGIGTGVRWKSPIGPLQIDLAYGIKPKRFRLHMSVGFVF